MIYFSFVALIVTLLSSISIPAVVSAANTSQLPLDMTTTSVGFLALGIFVVAYALVMAEEFTHLRKSKPVILAAGMIWVIISVAYPGHDHSVVEQALRHNILEYAELMLFLLVAMTYINAMEERLVFESLRAWLIHKGFTYRQLFWITGILAFFISPVADNLTTALLMCAVVLAVGSDNPRFVSLSCINIVVAANAGGAFSPFGDYHNPYGLARKGLSIFLLFSCCLSRQLSIILVPAALMHFAVPQISPSSSDEVVNMKRGAYIIIDSVFIDNLHGSQFSQFFTPSSYGRNDDWARLSQVLRVLPSENTFKIRRNLEHGATKRHRKLLVMSSPLISFERFPVPSGDTLVVFLWSHSLRRRLRISWVSRCRFLKSCIFNGAPPLPM